MRQAEPQRYESKPKISLDTAEAVLVMYWKPAFVQVGKNGQSITRWSYGLDPIKNKALAMERLLHLVNAKAGRFSLALLKNGIKGEVKRVWLASGQEITPQEFEQRRKGKGDTKPSLLRAWVLPHGHLLEEMKDAGLVAPDASGLTWYSADVDTGPDGKYRQGYDVAMFSLVTMLRQVRNKFAEARIFDNASRTGTPLAIVNYQGATSFKADWFRNEIENSKNYKPWQLGLFD